MENLFFLKTEMQFVPARNLCPWCGFPSDDHQHIRAEHDHIICTVKVECRMPARVGVIEDLCETDPTTITDARSKRSSDGN